MNINDLEAKFNRIQERYEADEISESEYAVLMRGLNLDTAISEHAADLQRRHQLYDAVVAASRLVKTII